MLSIFIFYRRNNAYFLPLHIFLTCSRVTLPVSILRPETSESDKKLNFFELF